MTIEEMKTQRAKYRITNNLIEFKLHGKATEAGFFTSEDENINAENKWRIIPAIDAVNYAKNPSKDYTRIIDGEEVYEITLFPRTLY